LSTTGIDEHLTRLTCDRVVQNIMRRTSVDRERITSILSVYAAESRYGFQLISPQLPVQGKILEVGAGLGMLSSFLRIQGYDITALEPCTSGFDFFTQIREVILEEAGVDLPNLPIRAEELNTEQHGPFDFIFSINVLEHIPELPGALRGMASVLAPGGRMWHTCPNYLFPYEPHYGIPLLPVFPRATSVLLPRRIVRDELWRSLNFITYFRLKRLARANGLTAVFLKGTMANALKRLDSDAEFAARQSGIASRIQRLLKAMGVVSAIGALPAALSTPMMIVMEKDGLLD
jgi:2-polyprenyl-3-methyl-5-hydroxy-6-metoxy-1,4-benzoquinol methylase